VYVPLFFKSILGRGLAGRHTCSMPGATDRATGARASEVPGDRHAPPQTYSAPKRA
jgi:hypothetical protein